MQPDDPALASLVTHALVVCPDSTHRIERAQKEIGLAIKIGPLHHLSVATLASRLSRLRVSLLSEGWETDPWVAVPLEDATEYLWMGVYRPGKPYERVHLHFHLRRLPVPPDPLALWERL